MPEFSVDPMWTDKDSKVDRFRKLYENFDFLDAYAAHTDLRVSENPQGAIGREDEWESHGVLQCVFLIAQGLQPGSRLLDFGCGTGRLARKVVPYLKEGHYTGVDISSQALRHALDLSRLEHWAQYHPEFVQSDGTLTALQRPERFDFVWAHSVVTHLPAESIETVIAGLDAVLAEGGKFLFTFKRGVEPQRTGLKQYRFPFSFFETVARRYGFIATPISTVWPAGQRTGLMTRCTVK